MKRNVLCLMALLTCMAVSCDRCDRSAPAEQQVQKLIDTPTIAQVENTGSFQDTIHYDTLYFPLEEDESLEGRIITPGNFHGDEVWDDAEQDKWFGLFTDGRKCYLAPAPVTIKKVFDGIVDDDSTKEVSGREVNCGISDTCLLLMSRIPDVQTSHDVEKVILPQDVLRPGESMTVRYKDVEYTLHATGGYRKEAEEEYIWNYKLYLTATKNGISVKQLLCAYPRFDDSMITFTFAGDIDGDGMLDFIIDNSPHYNSETPTLYLSKPAGADQLLKIVGMHEGVGC